MSESRRKKHAIEDDPESFYDATVIVTAGKYKGRIFNFDDYEGRTAYLYNPNIVFAVYRCTYEVRLSSIRPASFDELWKRREELRNKWIRQNSTRDDSQSVEMLLELSLIDETLFDQVHQAEMAARFAPTSDIFLSYSSKDEWFARRLFLELSKRGIRPWMYVSRIRPGDIIPLRISEALDKSTVYLILLSENAAQSQWVTEEWTTALSEAISRGKRIIVLRLDDAAQWPRRLGVKIERDVEQSRASPAEGTRPRGNVVDIAGRDPLALTPAGRDG